MVGAALCRLNITLAADKMTKQVHTATGRTQYPHSNTMRPKHTRTPIHRRPSKSGYWSLQRQKTECLIKHLAIFLSELPDVIDDMSPNVKVRAQTEWEYLNPTIPEMALAAPTLP